MNDYEVNDILFHQSLPMILHGGLDAVMPAYRRLFAHHGLTEQQWRVLRVLWQSQSLSSVEISRQTLIQPNSLVGVLERLERRSFIARMRSVEDRRIVFAKLTPAGRALGEAIAPALRDIHERISARLDDDEWTELRRLLDKASDTTTQISDLHEQKEKDHG